MVSVDRCGGGAGGGVVRNWGPDSDKFKKQNKVFKYDGGSFYGNDDFGCVALVVVIVSDGDGGGVGGGECDDDDDDCSDIYSLLCHFE